MKNTLLRLARYSLQALSLALFIFLFTYLVYPLEWQATILEWFSHLDPWMLIGQLRFALAAPAWFWLPVLAILATLLLGRVFCGWLCPFGAFMTLADRLGRLITRPKVLRKWRVRQQRLMERLLPLRYPWLLFLAFLLVLGTNLAAPLTPFALLSSDIVRAFAGSVPWLLIAFFLATVAFGRLWCVIFCPTGILLSLIAKRRIFKYRTAGNCNHCSRCAKSCPVGAAPSERDVAGEGCIVCGDCQAACPKKAIVFSGRPRKAKSHFIAEDMNAADTAQRESNGFRLTRRQFLQFAGTAALGVALSAGDKISGLGRKVLRPPGALPEPSFKAVCNRCGRCIKICPNVALKPMPLSEGIDAFETPYIIPREANCSLCMVCQEICPTGAIAKVPVEQVAMGKAAIDQARCLAWSKDKDCFVCGEQCLRLAISLEGVSRPVIQPDLCVGCGTCEKNCPVEGVAAIRVTPK